MVEAAWRPVWLARERHTTSLIRLCCDEARSDGALSADQIHALAKLTWIVKGRDGAVDNTRKVVAPALSTLLDLDLHATSIEDLAPELDDLGADPEIAEAAGRPVGFVNFYLAFRNSSLVWIETHQQTLEQILATIRSGPSDAAAREVYERVGSLPALPRPGAGPLPAFNLMTPLLACLDPRERCPVINSPQEVREKLRALGIVHASLGEQYDGVSGLIHQAGIDGALAFDTASTEDVVAAFERRPQPPARRPPPQVPPRPLAERHDEDVEVLKEALTEVQRRLHHSMTNALRRLCAAAGLTVTEGSDKACLFDALIHAYDGPARDLLIEVKTSTAQEFCRMAVGQLLDYRRGLPRRTTTDLCVLLPARPPQVAFDFLHDVGVRVAWLNEARDAIDGEVALTRR